MPAALSMIWCCFPVLFLFFFVAATATAQCNYQLDYGGPYRASYFDVVVDGNDLWTATGYGLQVFDRSVDPPRSLDIIPLPSLTRVVRASGGIAYAGSGGSIYVVRKTGNSLQLVRAVDAGGTVNDVVLLPGSLFAATSNGIAVFSVADPLRPDGGLSPAQTSSRSVASIAVTANELYAADNDGSVEVFNRSGLALTAKSPLAGLPRSSSVHVIANLVYVSDGQRTALFSVGSTSRITEIPFGTTSLVNAGGSLVHAAGTDRQLHTLELAVLGDPVELF